MRLIHEPDITLNHTIRILRQMVPCSSQENTIKKLKEILEARKRKTGVFISTDCGETHHVVPTQQVKEILLKGERIYPSRIFKEPQTKEEVRLMLNRILGGEWEFWTNSEKKNADYFTYLKWLHQANIDVGCTFKVPANPNDQVITPYAFYMGNRRLDNHISIWRRKGATMVAPDKVFSCLG